MKVIQGAKGADLTEWDGAGAASGLYPAEVTWKDPRGPASGRQALRLVARR